MALTPINQHTSLHSMLEASNATDTVIKSGLWSDPTIWDKGRLPKFAAKIHIPLGMEVVINRKISTPYSLISIEGVLRFDPTQNTELTVEHIGIDHDGLLEIGTVDSPVQSDKVARVIFKMASPAIDRTVDPFFVGLGLNSMGDLSIHGQVKDAYASVISQDGDLLILDKAPVGWRSGDRINVPSLRFDKSSEVYTIKYVNKNRIRFTKPLSYKRIPTSRVELPWHVSNLTRNICFTSWEKKIVQKRGHVMLMKVPKTPIVGASFVGLGRTDKSILVNDTVLDDNNQVVPGTGTNPRARYSLHFHQTKFVEKGVVDSCVVEDVVGWGFVNHESYVDFTNNVAYKGLGSLYQTESGNEIGGFYNNIAIGIVGDPNESPLYQKRYANKDHGASGSGFWLQGGGVIVKDNIATECTMGYYYYTYDGFAATMDVNLIPIEDKSIFAGKTTPKIENIPFQCIGNTSYYCRSACRVKGNDPIGASKSLIKDCKFWNNLTGIGTEYSGRQRVENTWIIGEIRPEKVANVKTDYTLGINRDWPEAMTYYKCRFEGYKVAIDAPYGGYNDIEDCYFDCMTNIYVRPHQQARTLFIKNNTIGGTFTDKLVNLIYDDATVNLMIHKDLNTPFDQDCIIVNDEQIYTRVQAPDYVYTGSIPMLKGKTNREIKDLYNESITGFITPDNAQDSPIVVGGKIGPKQPLRDRLAFGAAYLDTTKNLYTVTSASCPPPDPMINIAVYKLAKPILTGLTPGVIQALDWPATEKRTLLVKP